jgi:membrane protease YdiL (CAAX protease family)
MERRSLVIMAVIGSELVLRLVYEHVLQPAGPFFATGEAKLLYTAGVRFIQAAIIFFLAFDLCGFKTRTFRKEVLIGVGVSLAFGAAVLLSELLSRLVLQGGWLHLLLSHQTISAPMLFFLVGCVFGPFVEELFFRGVLYSWLRERMSTASAIVLSALLFAGVHQGFAIQLIGGLLFATIFEWRRSIWAGFIVHAAANTAMWVIIIGVGPR